MEGMPAPRRERGLSTGSDGPTEILLDASPRSPGAGGSLAGPAGGGSGAKSESPRIVLLGAASTGKSSIMQVVFYNMAPQETLHMASTPGVERTAIANSDFMHFEVWDCPGALDIAEPHFEAEVLFGGCDTLVYVIDAQNTPYGAALDHFLAAVGVAYSVNPDISCQVFIHKTDGLSDDQKVATQREISTSVQMLLDEGGNDAARDNCHPSYHLTSIYDHSILEAFSKVVQTLIPVNGLLSSLLDLLITCCRIEKAFLFDVVSKIYIATDSSPVDMQVQPLTQPIAHRPSNLAEKEAVH